tara:strand:- start:4646 stop:5242 length:597 start_codon:yes stop_codon:yes gene_type:complete
MSDNFTSPLFPLSINVLPGALLPLQIFEPRYIDMIKKCLGDAEGFSIVLTKDEPSLSREEATSIHDIGTYVEIVDFNQLDNGLLGITVKGKSKVNIFETWRQDDELLLGNIEIIDEEDNDLSNEPQYKDLWNMIEEIIRHPEIKKLNLEVDFNSSKSVCYILASILPLRSQEKQSILELDGNSQKLDYLKEIIKRLGG